MRLYLRTFGCRANQADTESVRRLALAAGAEIVDDVTSADVAVYNSCTVTAEAESALRTAVRRAARGNSSLRTVVMGCAAARDEGPLASLPSVVAIVRGGAADDVARALDLTPSVPLAHVPQAGTRALLRIQDGCAEHCTFCATTIARGAHRSRPGDALIEEAHALSEHHPEIVLTGTHIGSYGAEDGTSLGCLVDRLIREVPRVRFRLTSIEATEVDDRLHEMFGEPLRLAPHLHAPLQSASDRVLRRMGRHWYTAGSYARAVERLIDGRAVFALGADVIAGFPGESESDHEQTLALVRALPFSYLHVFPYSARPGTAAPRLGNMIDGTTIARRARELREMADEAQGAYRSRRCGGEADVVAIGAAGRREGMTEDYLTVALVDPLIPRGARFRARLAGSAERLLAHADQGMFQ